jgi:hypothetical protein
MWSWEPTAPGMFLSGNWYSKTYDLENVQNWTGFTGTISGSGTVASTLEHLTW